MADLRSRIQRIRRELRQKLDTATFTRRDLAVLRLQIADFVLAALRDDDHPLTKQLHELEELITKDPPKRSPPKDKARKGKPRKGKPASNAKSKEQLESEPLVLVLSHKHLFMPQPGTSLAELRQYWPLQLLMLTVATSPKHRELAALLPLDEFEIEKASKAAHEVSTQHWSAMQFGYHLYGALAKLDYPEPPAPARLEGRMLYQGANYVRLSQKEEIFVRLLLKRLNHPIPLSDFVANGVRDAANIKSKLLRKLHSEGITLPIARVAGGYLLHENAP